MGISGQLYHVPLPSGTVLNVDLREGLAGVMGNISATTSAGNVVGDNIRVAELIDVELYGLKLIADIYSWPSIVADLKGPGPTTRTRYGNF